MERCSSTFTPVVVKVSLLGRFCVGELPASCRERSILGVQLGLGNVWLAPVSVLPLGAAVAGRIEAAAVELALGGARTAQNLQSPDFRQRGLLVRKSSKLKAQTFVREAKLEKLSEENLPRPKSWRLEIPALLREARDWAGKN